MIMPVRALTFLSLAAGLAGLSMVACSTPPILERAQENNRYRCEMYDGWQRCHYAIDAVGEPKAVVIALHPAYTSPERVERLSGFAETASRQGFHVLYPEGVERHWNDGRGAGNTKTVAQKIDDVAYLTALAERYSQGRLPVFLIGMSNGGMMAMRMVLESPFSFAGMASVVGNLPQPFLQADLSNYRPLPVWLLFGGDDGIVPPEGGALFDRPDDWGVVASQQNTAAFFKRANGCQGEWTKTTRNRTDDDTSLVIRNATACRAPVTHITVRNGGHTWPGEPAWYAWLFRRGLVSEEMNATETILDWAETVLEPS